MKKNGFIATSLIYSFFLIFITLFLTIIADYIQNKILLNEIERGIKDEINDSMKVRNFFPGDLIVFTPGCTSEFQPNNAYVVANTDTVNNKLILYSFSLCKGSSCGSGTLTNFNDIPTGYMNPTYYNKIIYTFDKSLSKSYSLDSNNHYTIDKTLGCLNSDFDTSSGCNISSYSGDIFYRKRIEKNITTSINKCSTEDYMGAIYLDGSL